VSNNEIPTDYRTHLERQGFVLEERVGQGASGSVFSASQPRLNRKVAVKFFDSAFLRGDAAMQKRFSREARILARFQHQSIPFVITEGTVKSEVGEVPYFVMEFIHGQTLRERLNHDHKLGLHTAIEYSSQILDALAYTHSQNVVHRDLKPGNIMIDQRGRCFLIDFSIGVSVKAAPGLTRATAVGEQLGTTAYMSPEQISDSSTVDSRTDIFSMGVVLIEMITGKTDRTNIARALSAVPRNVAAAIEMACAHDRSERMRTADELQRSLRTSFALGMPSALPALAICSNLKCPAADWTGNGYYRGPKIHEASTDSFCTACGHQLKYQCLNCGAPFKNTHHCGACGTEMFRRPECKACGSWLTKEHMDDEGINGCRKCKKKIAPALAARPISPKSVSPFADMDDDIPF
jgi:eukaryotic-like serine/threonine-protein kinase